MRVLVSGASGLIGGALCSHFQAIGAETAVLVRRRPEPGDAGRIFWDPEGGILDPAALNGFDAVIHLAGENIGSGRWTPEKKKRIYDSRVRGTALLSNALAVCAEPPKAFVCASAVGYYGDRGEELLNETSGPGQGFLAETCLAWEAAAGPARDAGLRTVHLRTGMVLSASGGALDRMLPPFRLGLGGPLGNGKAWMSWIALDDLVRLAAFCVENTSLSGPVNAVAPCPVTNREFTRALGRALHRPVVMPVPAFVLRILFGEMARELLLTSTRAVPDGLTRAGFTWRYPEIDAALHFYLGAPSPATGINER
ncbi:MAG: TIGR01777 family protein [Candidatus Hydrogenedentes bacterium]|nr:TIGR01777 family protein [Candidatus Hydrogenedentota bacterium]